MKITVLRSAVIEAPIDRVWAVLRDFNSHRSWHPEVVQSQMENDLDGDVVSGVRRFSLHDGSEIREQLLYHSDIDHTLSYSILDSPLPLFDSITTIRLRPVTDGGHTFLHWRFQFRTSKERGKELEDLVSRQIYDAGIGGLRKVLFDASPLPPQPERKVDESAAPIVDTKSPIQAKAIVQASSDSSETVSAINLSVPPPKPGQVRLRLTALGINRAQGYTSHSEAAFWPPSIEGVGEIIDVGRQVHGLFPGDRVAYMDNTFGAYAEFRCIDADACTHLPEGVSDLQASTLFNGLSAQVLIDRIFRAGSGSTILLQNVSGGFGHIVSQWAKYRELTVLGTVKTEDEARFSRDHGCDYPLVVRDKGSLKNEVMRVTGGRGVDYWLHTDGEDDLTTAIASLARLGHLAVVKDRDNCPSPLDLASLKPNSLTVSVPDFFDYLRHRPYFQRASHTYISAVEQKRIHPFVEKIPFRQAIDRLTDSVSRRTLGAYCLVPDPSKTS